MRSKSGSMIFFRRNPAGSFTVVVWVSTFVFSAVGADVFPRERPYFLFRFGNPADDFGIQRGLSGDHLTHQLLVDFDTGMFRRIGCRFVCFLSMNPWCNVFEIEYSLYGHKARVFGFMS